jgi:uncharacterized protein YbjT (DUF2867 family)
MFVVAGISGNTGSVVANTLLDRKAPVRVLVRDAAKAEAFKARGAEVAVAELGDQAALTEALRGAKGAYLLIPPRHGAPAPLEDNRALAATMAAAVAAAKVPHVVLLSSIGAQHAEGTGPIRSAYYGEQALAPVTSLTAVRAAYFMENWFGALGALAQNLLPAFFPAQQSVSMVATADIGRTAAAQLLEGPHGKSIIELSGPREYSPADVAAILSTLTGKTINVAEAPLEAVVPTFTGFGMPLAAAEQFRELYEGVINGKIAWEGGAARAVRGSVTIEEVLKPALAR